MVVFLLHVFRPWCTPDKVRIESNIIRLNKGCLFMSSFLHVRKSPFLYAVAYLALQWTVGSVAIFSFFWENS